jgi:hypothetical protein
MLGRAVIAAVPQCDSVCSAPLEVFSDGDLRSIAFPICYTESSPTNSSEPVGGA